jgi:hypothetical protein
MNTPRWLYVRCEHHVERNGKWRFGYSELTSHPSIDQYFTTGNLKSRLFTLANLSARGSAQGSTSYFTIPNWGIGGHLYLAALSIRAARTGVVRLPAYRGGDAVLLPRARPAGTWRRHTGVGDGRLQ